MRSRAAMPSGTGLTRFAEKFPERFFDVGIAEEHAIGMAAGMAAQGLVPVAAIYSTFLQRAYDQIVHDIAIEGLHVVLCVDRAGIVGADGATHNGVLDIAFLRSIPGVKIFCPSDFAELRVMLSRAIYRETGRSLSVTRAAAKARTARSCRRSRSCAYTSNPAVR